MSPLVLPMSITSAPGHSRGPISSSVAIIVRTGVARITMSAPRTPVCRSLVARSTAPAKKASSTVLGAPRHPAHLAAQMAVLEVHTQAGAHQPQPDDGTLSTL
jgi:hypothetical protein